MKLHVSSSGSGPDLVLLHGWGMNQAVWGPILPYLEDRFRVWRIELPGHGASGYDPQATSIESWAQAVLQAAPESAHWIGWSLGGQLALAAASLQPGRVTRLAMVASSPRFMQAPDWPNAMPEKTLRQFSKALLRNPAQTLERFLSLQVRGDDHSRELLRLLRQELASRPSADPGALEQGLDFLLTCDLRQQLLQLTQPMLWLLGERDTLVPVELGDDLEGMLPDAEILLLQGCSHAPFLSHPGRSLAALNHFLEMDYV